MTTATLDRCALAFGRTTARVAAAAVAIGVGALVVALAVGLARPALGALTAAWLFAAGLAAGGVALTAAIRLGHGRWAGDVLPVAAASRGFFVPALVLLAVIVLAGHAWMPARALPPGQLAWVAARDLVATAVLFAVGWRHAAGAGAAAGDPAASRLAVIYLLLYAATLSLWAADLVLSLGPWEPSTVIPLAYFMGAFLSALAWVALVAAVSPRASIDARHDLGKLIFAFAAFSAYLVWSAFLPVWYANRPDETGFLLARWTGSWRIVTAVVLLAVFAWPFVFFFAEATKRHRVTLALGAAVVLAGLLGDRLLLVLPDLPSLHGWAGLAVGAGVTVGVLGLFVLTVGARLGTPREAGR